MEQQLWRRCTDECGMALLSQASQALLFTRISTPSRLSTLHSRCGSSFTGTRLSHVARLTSQQHHTKTRHAPRRLVSVQANKGVHFVEMAHEVGEHLLDDISNFIFHQLKRPFVQYMPHDWDPLHFLPVNIQTSLQKSEAIATLAVREILVFAGFYLAYKEVKRLCQWMYRVYTTNVDKAYNEAGFEGSAFQAAVAPSRALIMIWATTRLLAVKAVIWKLHGLITPLIIYKVRAVSTVCAVTWFLFRWKEQYAEDLIKLRPRDEPQIRLVDKVSSLAMYGLAASSIAEVVGLALGSLLAVGGVSGLAVGLAAKEVVSNMFGGASLFISQPFIIGEKIKAGDVSGRVEDIGFMQTKVQSFDGVPVLVPNQAFTSQVITNFSRAKLRALEAKFQLKSRHMFFVHGITEHVHEYLLSHPHVESLKTTPKCFLMAMRKDGPELALQCYLTAADSASFYRIQQEILLHVAQIITDALGEDSPFTARGKQSKNLSNNSNSNNSNNNKNNISSVNAPQGLVI